MGAMRKTHRFRIYHVRLNEDCILHLLQLSDLLKLINDKILTKETFIWQPGMKEWKEAGNISELEILFEDPPLFTNNIWNE